MRISLVAQHQATVCLWKLVLRYLSRLQQTAIDLLSQHISTCIHSSHIHECIHMSVPFGEKDWKKPRHRGDINWILVLAIYYDFFGHGLYYLFPWHRKGLSALEYFVRLTGPLLHTKESIPGGMGERWRMDAMSEHLIKKVTSRLWHIPNVT